MLPTVLIIEDDVRLAHNLKIYLERSGFVVRVSNTAVHGLGQFENLKAQFVLLDYVLPDLDGLEVLRRLLRLDPRVKVIVITAEPRRSIRAEAMRIGAYDFLEKPLVLENVRRLLETAWRQSPP